MTVRILITGGQGMLATDIARAATGRDYDVVCLGRDRLDVTNPKQVRKTIEALRPDYVVHAAGVDVDLCETNPDEGYRVHTWAAGCLARQSERVGATLVYISSCGLFGDEQRFYSEYDPVQLKTKYARSKHLGELVARDHCEKLYIVRPGWLFGGTPSHRRNFVFQRFKEAREKPVVKCARDKFGSPTYTLDLAHKILQLLETEEYGLYHITNEGGTSRYEYVKCIIGAFGLNTPVEPVDSSFFPRPAQTPNSEMLKNLNLTFLGLELLEPWEGAIHRYIKWLRQEFSL